MLTICRAVGVEYAKRFRWITNTAGTCQTPARLRPSCVSPTEKAPSPRNVSATRCSPAALERERGADRHRDEVAEHRDEREDVARGHAEVHVPVAATCRPVAAAEEVPQHVGDGDASREVRRELPVERADDVARPERQAGGGGDRLLPSAVVDRAGDPALAVEAERQLLDEPLPQDSRYSSSRVPKRTVATSAQGTASVGKELLERPRRRLRRGQVRVLELGCEGNGRVGRRVQSAAAHRAARTPRGRRVRARGRRRRSSVPPPAARAPGTSSRPRRAPRRGRAARPCGGRSPRRRRRAPRPQRGRS